MVLSRDRRGELDQLRRNVLLEQGTAEIGTDVCPVGWMVGQAWSVPV
ncbi:MULTISPECIES: hypothetical protein [Rhodococcus]|nr:MULTISPECIES: hypothetical protein [Rhodococcus]QQZ19442.1 hypothetical protein GO592_38885 [Rhodococcus sp. 21391]